MKVNTISPVSFKGKIIDAHMHVGSWRGSNFAQESIDTFVKNPLSTGDTIEKVIVSNLSCIEPNNMQDELVGNKTLLSLVEKQPKIVPLAVCQPKSGSVENIERLFRENPNTFAGLKFHPDEHQIMSTDAKLVPYLEFAQKNNLPCLFHCGVNWENGKLVDETRQFSSPEQVYQAAKKIPKTPVIMAHLGAGGEKVHSRAIDVLISSLENNDAKLYADISWVDIDNQEKPTIINLIKKLRAIQSGDKLDRLLFGSDAPIGEFATSKDGLSGKEYYEKVVVDIKTAIKKNFEGDADEIIDRIFYRNAQELFFKENIKETTNAMTENVKKSRYGKYVVAATIALVGTLSYLFAKKHKDSKKS